MANTTKSRMVIRFNIRIKERAGVEFGILTVTDSRTTRLVPSSCLDSYGI